MASTTVSAIVVFAGIASMAAMPPVAWAQQEGTPGEEGFFRPARDPALTRFPFPTDSPAAPRPDRTAAPAEEQALEREALERELDRSRQEHLQSQARAASPGVRPMIVSPLDGGAPIVSPLDGTAPIVSPLGR